MGKLIFLCGLVFLAVSAKANDIFITQNGAGGGTSCSDPLSVAYFNNSANWGTGKPIAPGTTVHLCGTFTGTAGEQLLAAQGSGVSGNPITIKFESGAVLTAPYWSAFGAINMNGKSYITVDGGSDGLIENTANGTNPTFQFQQQSRGIYAGSCTGCTVQNLTIANIYVHNSTSDTAIDQTAVNCVFANNANNFTINNMTCHDTGWAITGPGNNFTVENSNIYNVDHGIAVGASGTLSGFSIHDNHFHDYTAWDTGSADKYHHDGIHMWGENGSIIASGVIYNNLFDGNSGACCTTAHIFLQESIQNVVAFNNVILVPSTLSIEGIEFGGPPSGSTLPAATGNAAYNNFSTDGQHAQGGGAALNATNQNNFTAENNVLIGGQADISVTAGGSLSSTGIDHELYDDLNADFGDFNALHYQANSPTSSLATWQSECKCDANSLLVPGSQINADSTGHLLTGSKGIGLGTNLTSIATGTLAPLAKDKNGVPRPATGAWDVGAYETQGGTAINFGSGFTATGMAFNGSAKLNGNRLQLTSGLQSQTGSGWFTTPVNIQTFTTDFSFQLTNPNADGFTFTIQNAGATAIGSCGGGLAYGSSTCSSQPGIPTSVAVKYDLFQNNFEGTNSTGLFTDGATPTRPAITLGGGVDLHSGDIFQVHMTYDGSTLTMTITDTVTNTTFTTSWTIDIPATVGGSTALVGFTGATGGQTATQEIIAWTFTH